ncbi:MAG: DegT/DnrJ/EryC1/StrS family aminotransferase, partial [Bacteroidales bacterium]|nr:DegT/DnrJ/EryC1/StrS family aminotransferase [Bacteroidales bacterium]
YDHKYVYSHMGFNLKATDLQASIGVAQLEKLDYIIQRRRENFDILYGGLSQNKNLILPQKLKDSNPSWFGFIITVDKNAKFTRNELTQFLENHKIQTRNLFAGNLIKHPVFQSYVLGRDYRIAGELNVTDRVTEDTFWIGVYPGMSREKLEYMVETINQFGK